MALGTSLRLLGTEGGDGQARFEPPTWEGSLVVQQFLRVPTEASLVQPAWARFWPNRVKPRCW